MLKLRSSIVFVALALGCSGGGGTTDGGSDAAVIVNGCTTFSDLTAGGGTINFPTQAAPAQYQPNCARIKAGQTLTWSGSFTSHPLTPSGGDSPSPIQATATGANKSFTFPNTGTFGFACGIHASMSGAIEVVP